MASTSVNVQVFTDFDGTLSLDDTGLMLIDDHRSLGSERRLALEHQIMDHTISYKDALQEMWNAVHISWEEAWTDHLNQCRMDPGFSGFNDYCRSQSIPVTVVSSGLYPVISTIMTRFLGDKAKDIDIISNHGEINDREWKILWRDTTEHGNDKSITLKEARERAPPGTVFVFCGDGVSDISAARHADILFARKDRDLEEYCRRHSLPCIGFDTFHQVHQVVQSLVEGKTRLERHKETGFCTVVPTH
ncbi:HAD-like domain-containing protein [Spinellus fusiger]|nr:HAD-like domain-containing protein [Spinellus fusiger]